MTYKQFTSKVSRQWMRVTTVVGLCVIGCAMEMAALPPEVNNTIMPIKTEQKAPEQMRLKDKNVTRKAMEYKTPAPQEDQPQKNTAQGKKEQEINIQIYAALNTAEKYLQTLTEKPKDREGRVVMYSFRNQRREWNRVQSERLSTLKYAIRNLESIHDKCEGKDRVEVDDIIAVLNQKQVEIVIPDKDRCHPTIAALDVLNHCIQRLNALKRKFD